jgi:hypothetical protein
VGSGAPRMHAMDRLDPFARGIARGLLSRLLLPLVCALSGCGLFGTKEDIGFRTYTLEGIGYDEAASIVNDVTRQLANQLFGGVTLTWDPAQGNLQLDPIYDGQRRLRLYIHITPDGDDVDVEMFALVDHLRVDASKVGYDEPQQDVPLEEKLFQAYVTELTRRRDEGG